MRPYYDFNYEVQDALFRLIQGPLNSLNVANLPVVRDGHFEARDRDHIYIAAVSATEHRKSGAYTLSINVGVATLQDVTIEQHRGYVNELFGALRDIDLKTHLNQLSDTIQFNHVLPATRIRTGELEDSMRFAELEMEMMIYGKE